MALPTSNLALQVVEPQEGWAHTHTVILLHGRGSNGQEFLNEFFECKTTEPVGQPRTLRDLFPTIRWVFPSAPTTYSERSNDVESQWFDIWSVGSPNDKPEIQINGLMESIELVLALVQQEEELVPRRSIFLGGISQGFATAFSTFLFGEKDYAGLIGLCGWAPSAALALLGGELDGVPESEERDETPVFLGHSRNDTVVPLEEGRKLCSILWRRADTVVDFHEYPVGGHWINEPTGVNDIAEFLENNMDIE
ncbi:phospholipase/carboxylesterase [Annulohypoxylon maeteangense]|uniref:phospholipase/carboxylesterase n=1 Tax=Annulohypoxylon maeteangense TaxID=1927788 RepID=UPI002007F9BC|nr:phospholipase/carboxylesterase [Annulohypoxylon maeteangense]KAI0888181.1 phospholipase/carboxylesterase [Annulohypoxylon maeteangense]